MALKSWKFYSLIIVFFTLDLLTKTWAIENLPLVSEVPYIYPYGGIEVFQNLYGIEFSLSYTQNMGAAWGIFADFPQALFLFRSVFIFILLGYTLFQPFSIAWSLILVGAFGNLVDSFYYGFVIDFLHFVLWGYDYPIFNFADSYITCGVLGVVMTHFFNNKK